MATYWEQMTRPEHQPQMAIPVTRYSPDEMEAAFFHEFENEYYEFVASSSKLPSEQMGLVDLPRSDSPRIPVQLRRRSRSTKPTGNWTPDFVRSSGMRVVRDQGLVKYLKRLHSHRCQVCGKRIRNPRTEEGWTSHVHHLQPLGNPHFGPDVVENAIVVCPYHHTEFENGVIQLDLEKVRTISGHEIAAEFVDYNNEVMYIPE